jgi:biotin operon repressor
MNGLNEREKEVLKTLINQTENLTSGEFGILNRVDKLGMTRQQFAGHISQLKRKGVFEYLNNNRSKGYYYGEYAISKNFLNTL